MFENSTKTVVIFDNVIGHYKLSTSGKKLALGKCTYCDSMGMGV